MTNNKQQTAVQEHIAWLKEQLQECIDEGYSESWISAYKLSIKHAEIMLESEKEQIIKAHGIQFDYSHSQIDPKKITGEQYYNETYGKQ
jgi:hypothetical protein